MTIRFTGKRMVKAIVALLSVQVALCLPLSVKADSAIAGASVLIMSQPSVLGALSTFQVSITKPQAADVTNDATPEQAFNANSLLDSGNNQTTQPAVFSISGLPDQSFSIVMPPSGISSSAEGDFEFSNFEHNAGNTPTIGADGNKVFEVGALVKFTPFPTTPAGTSVAVLAGDSKTPDQKIAKKTPAEKDLIPRPNPFGIQGVKDGFLNVLVSYN